MLRLSSVPEKYYALWQETISAEVANFIKFALCDTAPNSNETDEISDALVVFFAGARTNVLPLTSWEDKLLTDQLEELMEQCEKEGLPKQCRNLRAIKERLVNMLKWVQDKQFAYTFDEYGEMILNALFEYAGMIHCEPEYIPIGSRLPEKKLLALKKSIDEYLQPDEEEDDIDELINIEEEKKMLFRCLTDVRYMTVDVTLDRGFGLIFWDDDFTFLYPDCPYGYKIYDMKGLLGLTAQSGMDLYKTEQYASREPVHPISGECNE